MSFNIRQASEEDIPALYAVYEQIGISVGLSKEYGAAQRLYVKQGYMPDGNGITYERAGVVVGQPYPVDDDLTLMMVKELL